MQGKILIVNKLNGSVLGWFGETHDDSRPTLDNIVLVELEAGQYNSDFLNLINGIEGIKVTDIKNKILTFDTAPISIPPTYEELQQELLQAQGVI